MSPERGLLPTSNSSDFTDSENNDNRTGTLAEKGVLLAPGELDVLFNDRNSAAYDGSAGNDRMRGIIEDYRAQYNSGSKTQKTHIVKKALADVSKGGGRFLLQISGSDEESIRWQEISPDDAAKSIQYALQTTEPSIIDGKKKSRTKRKASASSSYEHDPDVDQSDDTYEEGSADDADCAEGPTGSRKRHKLPIQPGEDIVSLRRTSPCTSYQESGTRSVESRLAATSTTAAILPLYVQPVPAPTSAISVTAHQTTVAHLLNGVAHHLSRAVSTAELLAYLHSVEAASTRCPPEIYDAIAAAVELLQPTPPTTPPTATPHATFSLPNNNPFPSQPGSSGINSTNANASRFHGTFNSWRQEFHQATNTTQELLESLASLVPLVHSENENNNHANWNQSQAVVRVIDMLLQSLSQAPPPSAL
jgi:hypothetical protein